MQKKFFFYEIFSYSYIKFLSIKDVKSHEDFIDAINNSDDNKADMYLCLFDENMMPRIHRDITRR